MDSLHTAACSSSSELRRTTCVRSQCTSQLVGDLGAEQPNPIQQAHRESCRRRVLLTWEAHLHALWDP